MKSQCTYSILASNNKNEQLKQFQEYEQHHEIAQNQLKTQSKSTQIRLLELQTFIAQKKSLIYTHQLQLKELKTYQEQLLTSIDSKQVELINIENLCQHQKKVFNNTKLNNNIQEVQEGHNICKDTLEAIQQQICQNQKIQFVEQQLNKDLNQQYEFLNKQSEINKQTIEIQNQQMQQNYKKIVRQLNLVTDMQQMLNSNTNLNKSVNIDETKQLSSLVNKLDNVEGCIQIDNQTVENLQKIIQLKEEIQQFDEINCQTEELITCDRTFSTPKCQTTTRFKAIDNLPEKRVRTEILEEQEYEVEKRLATDYGFYEEDEEENQIEDINLNLRVPWQSRKSLERSRKKKHSLISVNSFCSQISDDQQSQHNLKEELNFMDQLNDFYCSKKYIEIPPPCQTEQSITNSNIIQENNNTKNKKSILKQTLIIGASLFGIGLIGYKLFK